MNPTTRIIGTQAYSVSRGKTEDRDSSLEAMFDYYWRILASQEQPPEKQTPFGRWFIDRAWKAQRLAVELNGGAGGGYGRRVICHHCGSVVRAKKKDGSLGKELRIPYPSHAGQGAERDAAKINSLQAEGWTVLIFTSHQLEKDPAACIEQVLIELRKAQIDGKSQEVKIDPYKLTPREIEILTILCQGRTFKEIAAQLCIEWKTVKTHSQNIRAKIGATTLAECCTKAVARGLVKVEFIEP